MSNRHQRRADLRAFKREASSLRTYLVEVDDPGLNDAPLLLRASQSWLDGLSVRARHCLVCNCLIANRTEVGALLMSTPDVARPTSVGSAAICAACWTADLPIDAVERACATVLREVCPNGVFEPLGTRR
jgi:hypothetical protein